MAGNNHFERYLRGPEAESHDSVAASRDRGHRGNNGEASDSLATAAAFELHAEAPCQMLDLVFASGDRLALPYAYLASIRLDRAGTLLLVYASCSVMLEGRDLEPLYHGLLVHLVRRVFESSTPFDDGTTITWIKSIRVDSGTEQ